MDDELVTLFDQHKQEIIKTVKKEHFNGPMRAGQVSQESATWREFEPLFIENRKFYIRAFVTNDLHDKFFRKDRRIFGFDAKREEVLKKFESILTESGKGQSSFPVHVSESFMLQ